MKKIFNIKISSIFEIILPIRMAIHQKTLMFIYFLWDLLGLRFIFSKLITPVDPITKKRKPITLTLWILGIYVAMFGIASQRYENRIDIIEKAHTAFPRAFYVPAKIKINVPAALV